MKFEEAEKMLGEYDRLKTFFVMYRALKNEYENISKAIELIENQPFNYDGSIVIYNVDSNNNIVNSSLTPNEILECLRKHKETIEIRIAELMKENGIE